MVNIVYEQFQEKQRRVVKQAERIHPFVILLLNLLLSIHDIIQHPHPILAMERCWLLAVAI